MKGLLFASCSAASILWSAGAQAQTVEATNSNPQDGLGEIVVTANRTESAAQKTPVSLSVHTGEELAVSGVTDFASLPTKDPGINFTNNCGRGYAAIRSVASADTTEIGDPSVPVSRDGCYSNRAYALQLSMYDVRTSRMSAVRGRPTCLAGGTNGAASAHSATASYPMDITIPPVMLPPGNIALLRRLFG